MSTAKKAALPLPGIFFHKWPETDLVFKLKPSDLKFSKAEEAKRKSLYWFLICTEADSQNFFNYILNRKDRWSPGFLEFLFYWLRDERSHARDFAKLYSLLFGGDVEAILKKVRSRPSDFSHLEKFMADEFSICLLVAYDELATSHTYAESFKFYEKLNPKLGKWIRQVAADEGVHFGNLVQVLKTHHKHRLAEAPKFLESLLAFEKNDKKPYGATFVMDHSRPDFWGRQSDDDLTGFKDTLLSKLGL